MYHIKSPYANKWQERPGLLDNIPDYDMYDQALFTGDNVHIGGIGRVLDGTYEDMIKTIDWMKTLPDHCSMFPGHEYTFRSLKWN